MIRILGFESSCDETAAAIIEVDDNRTFHVLSDIVASQVSTHRLYGGVVPEIASRAHTEAISAITYEALDKAGLTPQDLDAVAVTNHPGLIGALLVAVNFAKSFAAVHRLPLYAVDHIKGHVAAAYLTETPPTPPFTALVVSGGHTSLFAVHSYTEYRTVGATRDDAAGESFDKIGRLIGIPYPAGAGFDALAAEGFAQAVGDVPPEKLPALYRKSDAYKDPLYKLPSPALADSLDLSFSGLKTAAINLLHRWEQTGQEVNRARLAARYTFEAVDALVKKTEGALDLMPGRPLVVAGGVAANSHLRAALTVLCRKKGCPIVLPPLRLCGDNGAMVAAQGYYEYLHAQKANSDLNAYAADTVENFSTPIA